MGLGLGLGLGLADARPMGRLQTTNPWNDATAACKQAKLWWVVVASTVAFNAPYGPRDGSAWMEKMLADGSWHQVKKIRKPKVPKRAKLRNPSGDLVDSADCADTMARHLEAVPLPTGVSPIRIGTIASLFLAALKVPEL